MESKTQSLSQTLRSRKFSFFFLIILCFVGFAIAVAFFVDRANTAGRTRSSPPTTTNTDDIIVKTVTQSKKCLIKGTNVCGDLFDFEGRPQNLIHASTGFVLHDDAGRVGIWRSNFKDAFPSNVKIEPGSTSSSFKIYNNKTKRLLVAFRVIKIPYPGITIPTDSDVSNDGILFPFWVDNASGKIRGSISPDNLATEWEIEPELEGKEDNKGFRIKVSSSGLGKNLRSFAGDSLRPRFFGFFTKKLHESPGEQLLAYYQELFIGQDLKGKSSKFDKDETKDNVKAPSDFDVFTFI